MLPFWSWSQLCLLYQLWVVSRFHGGIADALGVEDNLKNSLFVLGYFVALLWIGSILISTLSRVLTRFSKKWGRRAFFLLEMLVCFFIWIDLRLFVLLGTHILDPILIERLLDPSLFKGEAHLGRGDAIEIGQEVVMAFVAVLLLGFVARAIRRLRTRRIRWLRPLWTLTLFAPPLIGVGWTLMSHRHQSFSPILYEALTLYKVVEEPTQWKNTDVTYPVLKLAPEKLNGRSLLLIGLESFRSDNWSDELMPQTRAYFSAHPNLCVAKLNHYTSGLATEYGVFSLLYGVDGHHYRSFRKHRIESAALSHLAQSGYVVEGHASGNLRAWLGSEFAFTAFNSYEEQSPENRDEGDPIALEQVQKSLAQNPTRKFIFSFLSATHHDYHYPENFEFFKPTVPKGFTSLEKTLSREAYRQGVHNRYRNSVRYVDASIAKFLKSLEPQIASGTLEIALTGDHGEEFWDQGNWGHGAPVFVTSRIQVPLLWCGSNVSKIEQKLPSSHVDVLPTLLASAGASTESFSKYLSGEDLRSLSGQYNRSILVPGLGYPEISNSLAVIDNEGHSYWLRDGREAFELLRVTDAYNARVELSSMQSRLNAQIPALNQALHRFMGR